MVTALHDQALVDLLDQTTGFASREMACHNWAAGTGGFPVDIWRRMGREGFLGLNLPPAYGGLGVSHLGVVAAGEAMVRHGRNVGLAFACIYHLVVARLFLAEFANPEQHRMYLPGLAAGEITACLAVSEPGTGAHPKHIKTTAERIGDHFVLNGAKHYLTNGPIAGLFIVIAVTGMQKGRKEFTAFLVPRDTPGLSLTETIPMQILKSSLHCGIRLDNCKVEASRVLGRAGTAYTDMTIPFRDREDVYIAGLLLGGMQLQLDLITGGIRRLNTTLTDETAEQMAAMQSTVHTLRVLAYEMASMLDSGAEHPELPFIMSEFKLRAMDFQAGVRKLVSEIGLAKEPLLDQLTEDLAGMAGIGRRVMRLKQIKLGRGMIAEHLPPTGELNRKEVDSID